MEIVVNILAFLLFVFGLAYLILGIDDLFIDFYFWIRRLKPHSVTSKQLNEWKNGPQKRLAIMVAGWKEAEVLPRMVAGNLNGIDYHRFDIFLGVYPNDEATLNTAKDLARKYAQVHVVVNSLQGPTCKGQMLNEVVHEIREYEKKSGCHFDGMIIHDCEDIIHPYSLHLYNHYLDKVDFIQIPVFSLPTPISSLVAGTYMDQFAELHLKDILVRSDLNSAVPSAGVGTALSRNLINQFLLRQQGKLLNIGSLTEDYEMGLTTHKMGLTAQFACHYFINEKNEKEFIATRAYFPMKCISSIRQKSRWILGIAFQGLEHLGWFGSIANRYFLYRDRKGPWTSNLVLLGTFIFFIFLTFYQFSFDFKDEFMHEKIVNIHILQKILFINSFLMVNRILQNFYCSYQLYGIKMALLGPIRIVIGNFINAFASLKAMKQYYDYVVKGIPPRWIKTDHQLMDGFGEMEKKIVSIVQ